MLKSATPAGYRRAIVLDVVGALAIGSYTLMSFLGPAPFWAQVAYLGGAIMTGGSAFILRNYFSLACLGIVIACAAYQVVCAI